MRQRKQHYSDNGVYTPCGRAIERVTVVWQGILDTNASDISCHPCWVYLTKWQRVLSSGTTRYAHFTTEGATHDHA